MLRFLGVVLILAGCAAGPKENWVKAGADRSDLNRDSSSCSSMNEDYDDFGRGGNFRSCMISKGWRVQEGPVAADPVKPFPKGPDLN